MPPLLAAGVVYSGAFLLPTAAEWIGFNSPVVFWAQLIIVGPVTLAVAAACSWRVIDRFIEASSSTKTGLMVAEIIVIYFAWQLTWNFLGVSGS